MAGNDWQGLPVIALNGATPINIAFDELSHDYHRYGYRIVHCEADWSPSVGLFESDYLAGFYEETIVEDYAFSEDTYVDYTHYWLTIPNASVRLTMSGNYEVVISDEEEGTEVLRARFMVCEQAMSVAIGMTTNTDVDHNAEHQQISMALDYGALRVTQPERQLTTVVMQNGRWETAVWNAPAQYRTANGLRWEHCRELIFPASNEWFKFETLSADHISMGLEAVGFDREERVWHAYVTVDEPAQHYVYDVSGRGARLIRNSDNEDVATTCDYVVTHFTLRAPRQEGRVWVNSLWSKDIEMVWNGEEYAGEALLKQGYYSYRYTVDGRPLTTERDFFQTQNSYQALVYFRAPGDRADRLVGFEQSDTMTK